MKIKDLKIGDKLVCVKDIYYVSEDNGMECEFLTLDELMDKVAHLCVKGDVYKKTDDTENGFLCISGRWYNEFNDGWFDMQEMIDKGVFIFTP
jgi:hypothetical protein